MTVVRRQRSDKFAIVPNHVWDERTRVGDDGETIAMSFLAKGLLAYLLGRPNDWRIEVAHLRKVVGCGRDKAYDLVNELIEFGYATRDQERDPVTGKLGDFHVTIFDEPLPANQEPVPDRFRVSPLPANQEADKEKIYNQTPPLPPSAPRLALLRVLDEEHAEAVLADRELLDCPLTVADAETVARHCDQYADANKAAEILVETRYRGCRIRRPPKRSQRGDTSQAGEEVGRPTLGDAANIVRALEPAAFAKAIELSGWGYLADAKAAHFPPDIAERARLLVKPAAGRMQVVR